MSLGDPQSFNRYAYVTNDPLNFVDPSGLMMMCFGYNVYIETYEDGRLIGTRYIGFIATHCWDDGSSDSYGGGAGGGGGASTSQTQNPKATARQALADFLKFKSKQCADALKALGLTDRSILQGFDRNRFLPLKTRGLFRSKVELFRLNRRLQSRFNRENCQR